MARACSVHGFEQKVVDEANQKMVTTIPEIIAFRYESAVLNRDILSDYERAQSVSFITRFDHFPATLETHFTVDDKGKWWIANLWDLRQALNDFRSVIQNQSDSVHYQNVHNTWYKALRQTDKSKETRVRVLDTQNHDLTDAYAKRLGERVQAIRYLIDAFDYDSLYNGFLQHSDPKVSKKENGSTHDCSRESTLWMPQALHRCCVIAHRKVNEYEFYHRTRGRVIQLASFAAASQCS
jgi:hypothetical protein